MCGICGIVYRDSGRPIDVDLLTRMRDSLSHRGPDNAGIFTADSVGLGHRRLSIIDLSPDGAQPMANEDGSIHITYNGEVYNFLELRVFEARVITFQSNRRRSRAPPLRGTCAIAFINSRNLRFPIWDVAPRTLGSRRQIA